MTMNPLYALYAENARPASGADCGQSCPVCRYPVYPGERVADSSLGVSHVPCIAAHAQRIGGRH